MRQLRHKYAPPALHTARQVNTDAKPATQACEVHICIWEWAEEGAVLEDCALW